MLSLARSTATPNFSDSFLFSSRAQLCILEYEREEEEDSPTSSSLQGGDDDDDARPISELVLNLS